MINTKNISLFVWLTGFLWLILLVVSGAKVPEKFFQPISLIIGFWTIFLGFYEKWLWRYDVFGILFEPQPNLNGTWQGILKSNYVNPETKKDEPEIEIYLTVTQTFSTINYKMFTKEMVSELISGKLLKDENGQFTLYGVYRSTPNILIQERSPIHLGAIQIAYSNKKLEGSYWTHRETKGTILFLNTNHQNHLDFASAKKAFEK